MDLELALDQLRNLYQARPITRKWNDPTRQEMIDSLNKAHSVNKSLVSALDKCLAQLIRERKWRNWLISAFGATWLSIGVLLKWLIPYAIKGMMVR
jgi:hypothetical protein